MNPNDTANRAQKGCAMQYRAMTLTSTTAWKDCQLPSALDNVDSNFQATIDHVPYLRARN